MTCDIRPLSRSSSDSSPVFSEEEDVTRAPSPFKRVYATISAAPIMFIDLIFKSNEVMRAFVQSDAVAFKDTSVISQRNSQESSEQGCIRIATDKTNAGQFFEILFDLYPDLAPHMYYQIKKDLQSKKSLLEMKSASL